MTVTEDAIPVAEMKNCWISRGFLVYMLDCLHIISGYYVVMWIVLFMNRNVGRNGL
jgi:hypothetical protein